MRVWVDGALVEQDEARVSVFDHGLTTGDGVFETVKVIHGRPFALTRHLDRLAGSARSMGLPELDSDWIRAGVDALLHEGGLSGARLRVTVTSGVSPLGSHRGSVDPTVIVATAPLDSWDETCRVAVVPWPRNERGVLAGVKTTSYAENAVALAHAERHGASEAIFGNTAGNLCEGTGSNIFLVAGGKLVTPPLSAGCLAGVTRALVLEWAGAEEVDVPTSALAAAEEAFLTSTTRDIQPVRGVDGHELPAAPGPVTRKAMEVFAERSAQYADP